MSRSLFHSIKLLIALAFVATTLHVHAQRVAKDLILLYDFQQIEKNRVLDLSDFTQPLNLTLDQSKQLTVKDGTLHLKASTRNFTNENPTKVIRQIKDQKMLTVEAWITPANTRQDGPARIVTISTDPSNRNFTLGQEGNKYDVRLRTTKTSNNGMPSVSSPANQVKTKLTHLVYTFDQNAVGTLYVDGKKVASKKIGGHTRNWNDNYPLLIGNENTRDRPFLGQVHLVAFYRRALTPDQIQQNFSAGPRTQSLAERNSELFEKEIVPILAQNCMDCHGWKTRKGKLDLTRKFSAFKGGQSGKAIVPGKHDISLLYESIESDEMPEDRPPLTLKQKRLIKQWIDDGAHWSIDSFAQKDYEVKSPTEGIWVQRLTVPEYINTVRATTGIDITADARKILPPDLRADGFSNTAYNLNVDLKHVNAYSQLAQLISQRLALDTFLKKHNARFKLTPADLTHDIKSIGQWLLRAPLTDNEIEPYLKIAQAVTQESGTYKETMTYIIQAMLQSPRFIYRIENQHPNQKRPNPYELASRLSYILWGAPPDHELYRAAESGKLESPSDIERQIDRMLKDPRVIDNSLRFVTEWLNLNRLDNLRPNPKRFPNWKPSLATAMRNETLAFFKEIAWNEKRPLTQLFNAQVTFLTPELARHYGLPAKGKSLTAYNLKGIPSRGGLLTHGSILTIGGDDASMVTRGLFVLHDVLRGKVDDPPPGLDTTPIPPKPGMSHRDVSMKRLQDANCGGCHASFEPLAFSLEKYDGLGTFHQKDEHGNQLREDGHILFPDTKTPVQYKTTAEFMDILAKHDRVHETIVRKLTQFSLGRPLRENDEPHIKQINQAAKSNGSTYSAMIKAILMSDLIQRTHTEASK